MPASQNAELQELASESTDPRGTSNVLLSPAGDGTLYVSVLRHIHGATDYPSMIYDGASTADDGLDQRMPASATRDSAAEAEAARNPRALAFLHELREKGHIPAADIPSIAEDYEDWRAILAVIRAGWAHANRRGFVITPMGRERGEFIFTSVND